MLQPKSRWICAGRVHRKVNNSVSREIRYFRLYSWVGRYQETVTNDSSPHIYGKIMLCRRTTGTMQGSQCPCQSSSLGTFMLTANCSANHVSTNCDAHV
ncbi:hypothetical protein TNCT_492101 [Trichonephila clavata]|uniref:Uncharacterized protein n=1 Tax=Trichonephila clavata TaxID=2740835 RepID=A0A8X6GUR2_TRICU|nr:hypothetical protein TNCT_492101 [Trichonephila clavata]